MNPSTENMQKMSNDMMKACEDMNAIAMKSVAAMTKGCDETIRSMSGMMQEGWSRTVTAGKTIMDAKTPQDMMNLHSEFMKDCFDCWMDGAGRISEISARTTKEVMGPVAQHANDAMIKMMQKAKTATQAH